MRTWVLLVAASLFVGCFTPVEEIECTKDSECASWLACVEHRCVARSDGGTRSDGGGVDAGVDAGRPLSCSDPSPRTSWGNAAAELSGVQIGPGTTPLTQLTKVLNVTRNGDTRFTIVSAQLSRAEANDETSYVAIRVKNTGSTGACFVKTDAITYLGSTGQVVFSDTLGTYLNGSVATSTTSQVSTDTCLQPGEEGFMIDIVLKNDVPSFASSTSGVRLRMSTLPGSYVPEAAAFMPRSYAVTPSSFGFNASVVARNEGPGQISADRTGPLALMVPLDSEGRGLQWAYLGAPSSGVLKLRPCESAMFEDLMLFDGAASRAYFQIGTFSDCTGCARAIDLSTPAGLKDLLERRTRAEDEKRRALAP
ncbi:MAG: hypothetical protein QM817_04875 [Archangium sp.]